MLLMDKWDLALLQLGRGFLSEVENTFKNKPGTYDAFLHLLSSFKAKSIDAPELARKSHELFEGNHELAVRFDQFISQGFLEEAKKRLTSGPTKEDEHILEILGDQNKKKQPVIVDVQELSKEETRETSGCTIDIVVNRGDDCWQVKNPDSMEPLEETCAEDLANLSSESEIDPMKKSMRKMQHSTLLNGDVELKGRCSGCTKLQMTQEIAEDSSDARDRHAGLRTGQSEDVVHDSQAQCYQGRLRKGRDRVLISPSQHRGKAWCKSVSDLDLSRSLTCTPSYRLLPMKYLRTSSHLHPLRAEVLNDHWVCVPSGSQNYHLKHIQMNPYEEKLQQCEDECCEVDVLLECIRAAVRRMEELVIRLQSGGEIYLDDHLTANDWRCCERLYGECGLECKDLIRKDPNSALPLVINILKQKQDQLLSTREGLDKCWKEVYSDSNNNSFGNDRVLNTNDISSGVKKVVTDSKQERKSLNRKRREICN